MDADFCASAPDAPSPPVPHRADSYSSRGAQLQGLHLYSPQLFRAPCSTPGVVLGAADARQALLSGEEVKQERAAQTHTQGKLDARAHGMEAGGSRKAPCESDGDAET